VPIISAKPSVAGEVISELPLKNATVFSAMKGTVGVLSVTCLSVSSTEAPVGSSELTSDDMVCISLLESPVVWSETVLTIMLVVETPRPSLVWAQASIRSELASEFAITTAVVLAASTGVAKFAAVDCDLEGVVTCSTLRLL
jgi:hypothetical protein